MPDCGPGTFGILKLFFVLPKGQRMKDNRPGSDRYQNEAALGGTDPGNDTGKEPQNSRI